MSERGKVNIHGLMFLKLGLLRWIVINFTGTQTKYNIQNSAVALHSTKYQEILLKCTNS